MAPSTGGRWPAVTFRGRLVLATTAAVLVVVILGSLATYLVAYNSLIGSADVSLAADAQSYINYPSPPPITNGCGTANGLCIQVVYPDGSTLAADGPAVIPITDAVRSVAASGGRASNVFFSTVVGGLDVREVGGGPSSELPVSRGWRLRGAGERGRPPGHHAVDRCQPGAPPLGPGPLDHRPGRGGGGRPARTGRRPHRAPRPLNNLTETVEELAETTDVSRRLDPGGPDELGRLRRAFNRLLVALDTSRESQRQLVLDASHELRTPLTSLRTNMEVARRLEELDPAERQVLISDVTTQMDELAALVGDMAELARGEQPRVTSAPVRLDQIVLEAVEVATTHGRSREVTFDARVAPTWVSGSSGRIERAVDNLLDNALKWSPDGGVIEVACSEGTLIVRDHGPGVDEADVPHIFDRFYRAPGARGRPGSGLGLAIVAQVARDEGGSVNVYRAEGGGAVFRFSLPEVPAPHGPAGED